MIDPLAAYRNGVHNGFLMGVGLGLFLGVLAMWVLG